MERLSIHLGRIWGGKAFFAASLAAHPVRGDHNLGGGEWGQGQPCPSLICIDKKVYWSKIEHLIKILNFNPTIMKLSENKVHLYTFF